MIKIICFGLFWLVGNQTLCPNVNSPDQLAPGGTSYGNANQLAPLYTMNSPTNLPTCPTETKSKQCNGNNDCYLIF